VDEVAMDVVPVVFGSGTRYFGSVDHQHLLEDPDVVIKADRVLHLRYRVRKAKSDHVSTQRSQTAAG
jgi:retron-type reverse transcriptase